MSKFVSHIGRVLSLILVLSLLCSCTPIVIPSDQPTESTGEDIFTPTQQPTEATATPTKDPSDKEPAGIISTFHADALPETENGRKYISYTGGEIVIPCMVRHSGRGGKYGTGFLIFLDGQPQPYRTDEIDEYAFMHVFHHQNSEVCIRFTFTPVTGKAGDMLEFFILPITEPDWTWKDKGVRGDPTNAKVGIGAEIKMTVDPTEQNFPSPAVMLTDISSTKVDCPHEDIQEWSETDLIKRAGSRFIINGCLGTSGVFYNITNEHPISLDMEVWGTPYVHYGLVFFVDYQPVTDADGNPIFLDVESGKKTLLHAMLDMSDFEEERVVFAVLVPRNMRTNEVDAKVGPNALPTGFLLAWDYPNK